MKKVLVALAVETDVDPRFAMHFARATYLQKLARVNMIPVLISPVFSAAAFESLYAECSGALLMGGSDINPSCYGHAAHPSSGPYADDRDSFELMVTRRLLKDRKPILGICRGCQLLAVASGGSLIQDIPSVMPQALKHSLGDPSASYADYLTKVTHPARINSGTRLESIVGQSEFEANSAHHQSVHTLGADFVVSARSADNIVEAIEHRDSSYFCVALQCHPEALDSVFSDRVFAAFAAAVEATNVKTK